MLARIIIVSFELLYSFSPYEVKLTMLFIALYRTIRC